MAADVNPKARLLQCDKVADTQYYMQAAQALALLQWLGAELGQLPQAEQREALRLPLLLGGKLTSRVLARGLRAVLLPPQSPAQTVPSVSSRTEEVEVAPATRSAVSRVQSPRYAALLPPRRLGQACNRPARRSAWGCPSHGLRESYCTDCVPLGGREMSTFTATPRS